MEEGSKQAWLLRTDTETHGPFDVLVMNLPAPQLLVLLLEIERRWHSPSLNHAMRFRFEGPLGGLEYSATGRTSMLKWICRESSKPEDPTLQWPAVTEHSTRR